MKGVTIRKGISLNIVERMKKNEWIESRKEIYITQSGDIEVCVYTNDSNYEDSFPYHEGTRYQSDGVISRFRN